MEELVKYFIKNEIYPDEEFQKSEQAAIEKLKVPMKDNFYDYYNHKIWFTSDLHFGHQKDFLWGPRGFESSLEHDEAVIRNWNSIIDYEDEVYVLGDLMLGDNEYGLNCIKRLAGHIHIILGNHDTETRIELYKKCSNIVEITYAKEIKIGKNYFFLCHYPVITANYDDQKAWAKHLINLHGHTHSKEKFFNDNPYMYNVSLDAHDCFPIEINEIIVNIKDKKMQLDRQ